MKSALTLGIVVVALLGVAWWFLFGASRQGTEVTPPASEPPTSSEPSPTPAPSTAESCVPADELPMSLTVTYQAGQGFFAEGAVAASETFCVRKGAVVTFTGSNLWVASNPHPIHTDLSGFDAKGAKDSYSFTFDVLGEWGFHNHQRPTDIGTIIVVE